MAVPLVIGAGLWAYRGYRAYRAYQAAKAAAMVASAGAVAVVAHDTVDNARTRARETAGTTTDYCASCRDPRCRDQGGKIKRRRDELQKRYEELREDKYDLFRNHFAESNPHPTPGVGSWQGHIRQFRAKQSNLRKEIEAYKRLGCPELQGDHWKQASRNPPTRPAPKP